MASTSNYHDPDYPGTSSDPTPEITSPDSSEKTDKIKTIIRREFSKELEIREKEMGSLDQRLQSARHLMARLRYNIVKRYYEHDGLKLSPAQIKDCIDAQTEPGAKAEVASLLREQQHNIHPSLKKLLGKKTVDMSEIFCTREPRNKTKKDYVAMLKRPAASKSERLRPRPKRPSTESLEPLPKKVPKLPTPVQTINEITRNQKRERFRIIIGNTSKYAPPASKADRSTHKWLLYIRGPPSQPELAAIITRVTLTLHHSYAPHHIVHIEKPPFHVSRRGWGEFPAQIELHFPLPHVNRPATIEHTIKLDRNYTGLQTLGSETVVDVFLHSTEEMLKYVYEEEQDPALTTLGLQHEDKPTELPLIEPDNDETWLDFLSNEKPIHIDEMLIHQNFDEDQSVDQSIVSPDNQLEFPLGKITTPDLLKEVKDAKLPKEIQNVSPKKKIMKYVEPKSGKIYYFEMDKTLDLSKVQEIILNPNDDPKPQPDKKITEKTKPNNGVLTKKHPNSLLKPLFETKTNEQSVQSITQSVTKINQSQKVLHTINHIENDHCYLGPCVQSKVQSNKDLNETKYGVKSFEILISNVKKLKFVRDAVNYLLKNIPIVSEYALQRDYVRLFPFSVHSVEQFWSLDVAKRRNIEWSRAKLINTLLEENLNTTESKWRTKEILLFSRLYGFTVLRPSKEGTNEYSSTDLDRTYREWSSIDYLPNTRKFQEKLRNLFPNPLLINSLTEFNMSEFLSLESKNGTETIDETEIIDVTGESKREDRKIVLQDEKNSELMVLPVDNIDMKNRFMFIEKKCSELGIDLRNEDIGSGYSYSAVHAVILSAVRSFAEEIIRSSLASKLVNSRGFQDVWSSKEESIQDLDLRSTLQGVSSSRAAQVTPRGLGIVPHEGDRL